MSENASAVTRENLLGSRIAAGFIDLVLLATLGVVFAILFGSSSSGDGSFEISLDGVPFLIYVVVCLAYYYLLESMTGQTVGKMAAKIRVVSLDGDLTRGKVATRTILRLVDGFAFYLVAVIAIGVSKDQQRLGDMAAGTTVVRA